MIPERVRIALTGPAGCGKSTVAAILESQFRFTRTRFAAPLKNMLRGLYSGVGLPPGEIDRRIEGDLKETPDPLLSGHTPRFAMQTLGTEWRDLLDTNLWTNLWRSTVPSDSACCVEDCRFDHEYDAVKELGFVVVSVQRNTGSRMGHSSERGLPDACPVDYELDNTGSLTDLRVAVGRMLYVMDNQP